MQEEALVIFEVLLETVQAMHDQGIIHRDLKPENIIFHQPGEETEGDDIFHVRDLKILDFGIAKLVGADTLTRTGILAGTVQYLPPEVIAGNRAIGENWDFYSLGIILYEMLTGDPPFCSQEEEMAQAVFAILHEEPIPPDEIEPALSPALNRFCLNLIRKNPENRLCRYAEIRSELEKVRGDGREM